MRMLSLLSILTLTALVAFGQGAVLVDDALPDDDAPTLTEDSEEGWSDWSEWSPCSRTCDDGASVQSRRCLHYAGCRGDSVRYKLCNLGPCPPGSRDFRAVQCSEYDGLPHEGNMYEWEPAEGEDPCALTCRARGGGPVVTLNPRVQDGTKCSKDSQDICINGRCQKVGCDQRLGSQKTMDACGLCGGDGSSCTTYHWDEVPTGPCSATCGGGYQVLTAQCVESGTGRKVQDELCDVSAKPTTVIRNCNVPACPTSWQTGDWGSCSVSCGSGYQLREVYCAEPRNTSVVRVADHYCTSPRPPHRQPCNTRDCPRWYDGIWSQCSVTCGDGVQSRVVLCRDSRGRSSQHCDPAHRPENTRSCRTGVTCPPPTTLAHPRHQPYTPAWWTEEQDLASEEGVAPLMPRPQALTADQQVPSEPTYMTGNWSDCSVKCGEGVRTRTVTCKIFLEFSRTVAVLPDDQCPGVKPPQAQRCMMPPCSQAMTRHDYPVGEVSDAAQDPPIASLEDAHEGLHLPDDHVAHETPYLPRLVDEDAPSRGSKPSGHGPDLSVPQAQAYNEPRPGLHSFENPGDTRAPSDPLLLYAGETNSRDQFESYELTHEKPHHVAEHSEMNSIEIDMGGGEGNFHGSYHVSEHSNSAHIYEWFSSGFTPCSASCLGGVQETVIHCVRTLDKKIVMPQLCKLEDRPDVITRTCNDQPCPPRWNVSEFGACSKPCGGGIQTREVKCIHEVTRGGQNTIEVQDSLCPQPPHRTQQSCNFFDCEPKWVPTKWSKCSVPCGGGTKTREIRCHQTLARGNVVIRSDMECSGKRPATSRKCNRRLCQGGQEEIQSPIIYAQIYQNYNQSKFMRKVTLKVGGRARVFRGVMVKVKCPVRRFDRSKITWWHDGSEIGHSGSVRTTNKGVLKIKNVQYPNRGVYICKAERSEANLTLEVIPLPSSYTPSQERESGSVENEVSLHIQEGRGSSRHEFVWPRNKSGKKKSRNGRRRQNSRGGSRRRKNKSKSPHPTHTTLRPIEPYPAGPESDTLGEGPFKASSKNIHTVEVTSGEAANGYDANHWNNENVHKTDDSYVYGTISHHAEHDNKFDGWDRETESYYGITNHLSETKKGSERPHVYGKITHHSDGSRITSEESQHIFGTIRHGPPDNTLVESEKTEWPGFSSSTELYFGEKNRGFNGDVDNAIEDDLTSLGKKLLPEDTDSGHQHRQTLSWSGHRPGSRNGHSSSGPWRGHSSVRLPGHGESQWSDHSESQWSGHGSSSPSWFSSTGTTTTTTTTSKSPSSWFSRENIPDQHNHWSVDDPPIPPPAPPNTSSGGSRSMPYFQKLLSNLERSIGSRGGRHVASSDTVDGMMMYDSVHDSTTTEDPMGTPEILGKGTRDSLEFEWQMTNWSACSQTCGFSSTSTGFQVRSIQCLVRVNNVSRAVDGALCVDAGLEAPVTIQKCGFTECPHWNFDEWSPCETSRCFTLHYAFQRRDVVCQVHNGTIVSNDQCDSRTKPRHRRECYNKQCTGVWRVGEWSECTAPCGGQGYRTRLLQCVWNGTKRAAGNACRELPRPEVVRWCDGQPCPVPSM